MSQPIGQSSAANKAGRPPFLTEVKRAEICAVVASGCSFRTAAKYVGCTVQAISALTQCDREFGEQLDRAVAQREVIPLSYIREASKHSWRAAAWLLEKTVGGRYGEHVMTLEEEVDAEKSEELAATLSGVPRAYDERFVADVGGPVAAERTVAGPVADKPNAEASEVEAQSSEGEVHASGLDEFMRGNSAADHEARHVAAMLANLSPMAEPSVTADDATSSDAAARLRNSGEPANSRAVLKSGVVLSETVSPQSILESMQALDELWSAREMGV